MVQVHVAVAPGLQGCRGNGTRGAGRRVQAEEQRRAVPGVQLLPQLMQRLQQEPACCAAAGEPLRTGRWLRRLQASSSWATQEPRQHGARKAGCVCGLLTRTEKARAWGAR